MAALPPPRSPTVDAIYASYEAANPGYQSEKIGAASIGTECDRALWYALRWISKKTFDGRMLRLFETGHLEEARFTANLRATGAEVHDVNPDTQKQWRFLDSTGHIVCKIDAAIVGLLEAPKTWHVGEFKTHSSESFKKLQNKGLLEAKPEHWWQCQIGMHLTGMKRAFYLARNKDTDHLWADRLEYDKSACEMQIQRAQRIIVNNHPPTRISNDPSWFGCKFCDHRAVCHENAPVPRNCRTCMHVTPADGGTWHCDQLGGAIERETQKVGCPMHAYIPALVPGEQIDAGQHAGGVWVRYKLRDGSEWTDGAVEPLEDVPSGLIADTTERRNAHAAMHDMPQTAAGKHGAAMTCYECGGVWPCEQPGCPACGKDIPF